MIRWIFRRPKLSLLVVILSLSSAYLYVFPAANLAYIAIVLLHAALGLVAALFLVPKVLAVVRAKSFYSDLGWLVLAAGAILGVVLLFIGTIRSHWAWMYVHVVLSFLAVALCKRLATKVAQLVSGNIGFVSGCCGWCRLWRMEPSPVDVVPYLQVHESCFSTDIHERGRGWAGRAVFSKLLTNRAQGAYPGQLFHGIRCLPALP